MSVLFLLAVTMKSRHALVGEHLVAKLKKTESANIVGLNHKGETHNTKILVRAIDKVLHIKLARTQIKIHKGDEK